MDTHGRRPNRRVVVPVPQLSTFVCTLLSTFLSTPTVGAALEEVAGTSPHLLDELVDEDWGRRYGRPVRLGKNPTKPKTRILATENDAVRLLEHLYRRGAQSTSGPRIRALRQIMTVGFPPRELRDLRLRVRTEQQTPEWKIRYAVRSGVEGTVNEFAHGHGMRRCRRRGQGKAHIQHVLTAIAVNIERLSGLTPTEEAPAPRRPTAFQNSLDERDMSRPKSWRTLGT
ncbi:transposase [Streptomyces sp. NPDC001100]